MTSKVFTDSSNRSFNVRFVNKGDKYGRNLCLTNDQDEPLVEFYDVRYAHDKDENGRVLGQFVSRYNRSTVLECAAGNRGINLHGDEPSWRIGADAIVAIGQWLEAVSGLEAVIETLYVPKRRFEHHG